MDPRDAGHVFSVGAFVTLVGAIALLWRIVPTKLDIAWQFLLTCVAGAIGGLLWIVVLSVIKQWGLEPESTNPFGGVSEARLIGGACLGFVYFFPLAASLAFVDIKLHADSLKTALLANSAFLLGSTIGAATFYGLRIRVYVSALGWTHLQQESALVLIWSSLIMGTAIVLYALAIAILSKTSILASLARAALGSLIPILLCYLTVFVFVSCCATADQPHEEARGVFVGVITMWSITLAHEVVRAWLLSAKN